LARPSGAGGLGQYPDQLVLGSDPPLGRGLTGTLEVREEIVRRADRNGVVFVDEVHAVLGL
jgi:hypothetical protein